MNLFKYFLFLFPAIFFVFYVTIRDFDKNTDALGTRRHPIKIFFTPSVDAKKITNTAQKMLDFLEKETGYTFSFAVPADYVTVVESFGSGKADIAAINTFSYLMANDKYGATALLRVVRDNEETTYRGQIITKLGSGIDSIADLQGKKMAYVDPSSTSGSILPKALLKKKGIKPSEEVYLKKHDMVVTAVYQGQVDAGATYYSSPDNKTGEAKDARARVLTQYPDVLSKIKIIQLTDEIPNDPIVFRKDLTDKMKTKIVNALLKFVSTKDGQEALYDIYSVKNLVPTTDKDYDILRDMLKQINFSVQGHVK